jgi:serine/threonine protein kinase
MGGGISKPGNTANEKSEKPSEEASVVEWKILPSSVEARKKFVADGTLTKNSDPEHLELRTMLDEAFSQNAIGKYAKDVKALDIFMCWVDIQEFKSIPKKTEAYKRSKALHIYHKYIKQQSVLEIGDIDPNDRDRYKADVDLSKDDPSILTDSFYDKVQFKCFLAIYHHIYIPFKLTPEYYELTQQIKKRYNNVRLSDFEYFNKLGEGGFGFVVHCRKKSTGKHYAMKLQTKTGLLECFQDDPLRADFEKQAFASCQHPFIVNLDYAFQTDSLAIMVLGLATAGDLQKALNKSPEEKLGEDRVRFYVAEMVLALSYLHQLGLMYRDLKPNNVLLNEDGHIQLVDLGGVADEHGTTLGKHSEVHGLVPLFTQTFAAATPNYASLNTDGVPTEPPAVPSEGKEDGLLPRKPKRKLSIMGTFGYMAPEMVIMLSQASYEKTGYTVAVDWWSLGVTMFKLLTGYRPFTDDNFNTFVEMATTMNGLLREHCDSPEYAILFQEIPFPAFMSPEATDLIGKLLDVNDKTRLGSGPGGVKDIQSHVFFKGIDWDLMEQKHVEPPFKPDHPKLLDELVPYPDFETLMRDFGKSEWLEEAPPQADQKYFLNWSVIH